MCAPDNQGIPPNVLPARDPQVSGLRRVGNCIKEFLFGQFYLKKLKKTFLYLYQTFGTSMKVIDAINKIRKGFLHPGNLLQSFLIILAFF